MSSKNKIKPVLNKSDQLAEKDQLKFEFLKIFRDPYSIENEIAEVMGDLWPKYLKSSKKERKKMKKDLDDKIRKLLVTLDLDTHGALAQSVHKDFSLLVVNLCREIEAEYRCGDASEKALAQVIAHSFVRYIRVARKLEYEWAQKYISHTRNVYIKMLGRELDRASRLFIAALNTLKTMKSPPPRIKVQAKTAFVAQNQQLIAKKENNEPK